MNYPGTRRAGIIDIGSNSVRLVIYDVFGASLLPSFNEKVMAGLGEGLMETGQLSKPGVDAAISALSRYRAILKALNVQQFEAVATAAVRTASDGPQFLKSATRTLGREIRLLSGQDEARLSALGVSLNLNHPEGVAGDLGGSSLELQPLGNSGADGESLMLGPLSLAGELSSPKDIRRKVREALKESSVLSGAKGRFYAVGGAWRGFGRLVMQMENYPLHVLQGYQITEGQVARGVKLCIESLSNAAARSQLEVIDRRRARYMPVAAIILEEILSRSQLEGVTISAAGVREGALQEFLALMPADPLADGIIAFARLDSNQIAFGRALHEFIGPALMPQPDLFGSPAADERIERAACMMADSAGRFHPDHRAELAYDQALRAPYQGVSHPERAMIALAVGCRYDRNFKRPAEHVRLMTEPQADRARLVGALMLLGAVFSGRSGPILRRAKLRRTDTLLELSVSRRDKAMVSATVERRLAQAAATARLESRVLIG